MERLLVTIRYLDNKLQRIDKLVKVFIKYYNIEIFITVYFDK